VERISRRGRAALGSVVAVGLLALLVSAVAAATEPRVLSAHFDRATVVGRDLELTVRGVDPGAPVSGAVVSFGKDGTFATSACAVDSSGRPLAPAFEPGAPVNVTVPESFGVAGKREGAIRLQSGGCRAMSGAVLQPLTVTATQPGQLPVPPELGEPVPIDVGQPGALPVPGGGELPPLPIPVTLSVDRVTARLAGRCWGANRHIGPSRSSVRRARIAILCLVNAQRRRGRLRGLTANRRLRRAALGHSRAMVVRRFFSHVEPGGVDLVDRLYRSHYLPGRRWMVGENIAIGGGIGGFVTPARVVSAWMRSTSHREVILTDRFREAGLGIVPASPAGGSPAATYTMDFGFRR
jgi:uncharacterized protein YkwD